MTEQLNDIQDVSEELWSVLSEKERLLLFCAVIRRLHVGELQECRSYRGVLYNTFGFNEASYHIAQHAGFLDIHNSIINKQYLIKLFLDFASENKIELNEEVVEEFLRKRNIR
jgi:hypothetical protein